LSWLANSGIAGSGVHRYDILSGHWPLNCSRMVGLRGDQANRDVSTCLDARKGSKPDWGIDRTVIVP